MAQDKDVLCAAVETTFWCNLLGGHDSIDEAYGFFHRVGASKGTQASSKNGKLRLSVVAGRQVRDDKSEDKITEQQFLMGLERLVDKEFAHSFGRIIWQNYLCAGSGTLSQGDFLAAASRWQGSRLPQDQAAARSNALKRHRRSCAVVPDKEDSKEEEAEEATRVLERKIHATQVRLARAIVRRDEAKDKLHSLQDETAPGAGDKIVHAYRLLKDTQIRVSDLRQAKQDMEEQLDGVEAGLQRLSKGAHNKGGKSIRSEASQGGSREWAGQTRDTPDETSALSLHQAKCLWAGRQVHDEERQLRELNKRASSLAGRRSRREAAERGRIAGVLDRERMMKLHMTDAMEAIEQERRARDRRVGERAKAREMRGKARTQKLKKEKDQRERERVRQQWVDWAIERRGHQAKSKTG